MELQEEERKTYLLDDERIDLYWGSIEKLLEDVPGLYDLYDARYIYDQAKMGAFQIWALSNGEIEGIVVTQILVYPKTKVFFIHAAAGKGFMKYFEECTALFDWLARDSGCEFIQTLLRPGLARKMKKYGMVEGTILRRRVSFMRAQ